MRYVFQALAGKKVRVFKLRPSLYYGILKEFHSLPTRLPVA